MTSPPLNILRIDARRDGADAEISAICRRLQADADVVSEAGRKRTVDVFGEPLSPHDVVERICGDVRRDGVDALLDYSARLDGTRLTPNQLRVPPDDLEEAHRAVDPPWLDAVRRIRDQILDFQRAILHTDARIDLPDGVSLRQRYLPIQRVGLCVPGGAAAYPSTLLMTAVPAQAAGVGELAVVAPATPFGAYNRHLLATCHELGITEVYRCGGAQAVAALAYGVDGLRRVDKIVGPGNLFVALAKRHVFGHVDIDAIAGPSEVVVIADETARADATAADMLAQAEHAPGASLLITWDESVLEGTVRQLSRQLAQIQRGDLARQSLEDFGALILVRDADQAADVSNQVAPEHLHIATADPESLLPKCVYAGAIFLGHFTPVALGDYVAGPSHVLPTGGTARFASGLSANDFLRAGSVIHFSETAMRRVARDVRMMADVEGLTAHRATVDIRDT